jgi:AMIN domain-containing protein
VSQASPAELDLAPQRFGLPLPARSAIHEAMRRTWSAIVCGAATAALFAGCARHSHPTPPSAMQAPGLESLSVPLDVSEFHVVAAEGFRGVFVKLSRLPDAVQHHEQGSGSIVLDISGPTGSESPEESYPGGDPMIASVRVSRTYGKLRVAIDLATGDAPSYTVHTMADWIMVRFAPEERG